MEGLSEKAIIITGAGGDIGSTLTHHCLQAGAQVAALDHSEDRLRELERAACYCDRLRTHVTDVTDEPSLEHAFAQAWTRFGRIDALINAAGIEGLRAPFEDYPLETFQTVMSVNVVGVFLGLKLAMPRLRQTGGAVVNLASTAGLKGTPHLAAYVASKHAVVGLTRVAALEGAPHGVRVNAVCPSAVEGRMIESIYARQGTLPSVDPQKRRQANPSGRYATPSDVAALVGFLLSDAAAFVNGACYTLDGGNGAG